MRFKGNVRSAPIWAKDFGGREHIAAFPGAVDPTQFIDQAGIVVTVDTGGAAIDATSVPVVALTGPATSIQPLVAAGQVVIPAGSVVDFGAKKFARLTADAKVGDITLTVSALSVALVAGDTSNFSRYNTEYIPSGTLVGRTLAQRDAGTPFQALGATDPATLVATPGEVYLLMFDIWDAKLVSDCELYRHNSQVAENYLPTWTTLTAAQKAWIRANYQCFTGVD